MSTDLAGHTMEFTRSSHAALCFMVMGLMCACYVECFVVSSSPSLMPLPAGSWAEGQLVSASQVIATQDAPRCWRQSRCSRMMAGALDETKGVTVNLGNYKGGAISVEVPRMEITDAQVEAALVASKKPYKLIPVRFVEEGGTKMGHTVIINWEAKDVKIGSRRLAETLVFSDRVRFSFDDVAPQVNGVLVPGAKKENFELELKEGHSEPWHTFAAKIAVGMGQMETKVFSALFPDDFEIEGLRGKEALVQVVVKSIARREDKPPETRSDEELRVLLRQKGEATMQSRTDQAVDEAVKKALLESCEVNADKVLNTVSWAKFGEKSTLDFKWNCVKEKIASEEGIEPREVVELLRKEAKIVFSSEKR